MVEKFKRCNFSKDGLYNKIDLGIYLYEESKVIKYDFYILGWWKGNAYRFPILSYMANDVLAISISSVALKSIFSASCCILDIFRISLSPNIAQSITCVQD